MTHTAATHTHAAPDPPWSRVSPWLIDEIVDRLTTLWKTHTSNEIAKILSQEFNVTLSRAAVTGKLDRLGLLNKTPPGLNSEEREARKREQTAAYNMARRDERAKRLRLQVVPSVPSAPISPAADEPPSLRLTLLELEAGDCRWPSKDSPFTFCGHPAIEGLPYCRSHCAIAYRPREERRRA